MLTAAPPIESPEALNEAKERILRAVSLPVPDYPGELTLEALMRAMPREWKNQDAMLPPYPMEAAKVVIKAVLELMKEEKIELIASPRPRPVMGRGLLDFAVTLPRL